MMTFDMVIITPPAMPGLWLGVILMLWTLQEFLPLLYVLIKEDRA